MCVVIQKLKMTGQFLEGKRRLKSLLFICRWQGLNLEIRQIKLL